MFLLNNNLILWMDRQQLESRRSFIAISSATSVLKISALQARSPHQMAGCFMSS
jgi:hypothetical protein